MLAVVVVPVVVVVVVVITFYSAICKVSEVLDCRIKLQNGEAFCAVRCNENKGINVNSGIRYVTSIQGNVNDPNAQGSKLLALRM